MCAKEYGYGDESDTDHYLQLGFVDAIDGVKMQGRAADRPAAFGYCAFCGWKIGGQQSTRAVRRAFDRHVAVARQKEAR